MDALEVNDINTIPFGWDLNFLLTSLMNVEAMLSRPKYKELYYFKSQIWFKEDGFYLTFQTYDAKTNEPCIAR